jgi:uncharacterized membrane protein YtjA (UPF0391 family)
MINGERNNNESESANMSKWKYTFLTVSLIALAVGFSGAQANAIFYLGRPVGAILFGLFLVTQVLEKEWALYDKQNRAPVLALQPCSTEQQRQTIPQEVAHHPALTKAYPH